MASYTSDIVLVLRGYLSKFIPSSTTPDVFHILMAYLLMASNGISALSLIWSYIQKYLIITVEIRYDDEMYNVMLFWMSQQPMFRNTANLVAGINIESPFHSAWSSDDEHNSDYEDVDATHRNNLRKVHFTPATGTHSFRYKDRWFTIRRQPYSTTANTSWLMNAEKIYLSHIGWNANVIKNLLLDAQRDFAKRDSNRIIIYRGESRPGTSNWDRCASRAARQLSSVILDKVQKDRIVKDVDEYLSQSTRSWYKRNGIPYRRGYLLQGPPGTGKTSLCVALAGRFKMNIYLLSLNSLDELSFSTLFRKVPEGSIILLEDIDRAGVTQKRSVSRQEGPVSESEESRQIPFSKGISLSALLNEIDGVAAKENRILVMTTNHAEHLDPALLRPGRVDMTLTFSLANKDTIFRIFCSMYGNSEDMDCVSRNGNPRPLHDLATQFTQQIPADVFSPAEIQEYILQYKSDPEKAVQDVADWAGGRRKDKYTDARQDWHLPQSTHVSR
ncbi:hypothetical protein AARAC_011767 [Aspergillus arachidicola]|uniref:BCS1-like ATPase n=1 Tax=Aspergillus arachidicola TaxID=656916 RepID=A0A2G7GBZ1_9EURO|nr:hypothetical protein AARAC_011767 [Aspergillus arachidicola]